MIVFFYHIPLNNVISKYFLLSSKSVPEGWEAEGMGAGGVLSSGSYTGGWYAAAVSTNTHVFCWERLIHWTKLFHVR